MNKQKLAFPNLGDGEIWDGMELRDYFAAQAMQGLLACMTENDPTSYLDNVGRAAYMLADKMIDERNRDV